MASITAVITTYNFEHEITKLLDSLFTQSFQDFKVLLIDDCSNDKTVDVVKMYITNFPDRIDAIFLQKNMGIGSLLWNIALDSGKIKSNYVIFLDGDDYAEQDFFGTLFKLSTETQADISVCAYDRREAVTGRILCEEMKRFPPIINLPDDISMLPFINTALWNKLIKTSIIGSTRSNYDTGSFDVCFIMRLYQKCERIAFTDEVLFHYQVRTGSIMNTMKPMYAYLVADELREIYVQCIDSSYKNMLMLTAFIHIGISIPVRLNNNPQVSIKDHLLWTRSHFIYNYNYFKDCKLMKLFSLRRFGTKGYGVWICYVLYKLNIFRFFLFMYKSITMLLHRDIKW